MHLVTATGFTLMMSLLQVAKVPYLIQLVPMESKMEMKQVLTVVVLSVLHVSLVLMASKMEMRQELTAVVPFVLHVIVVDVLMKRLTMEHLKVAGVFGMMVGLMQEDLPTMLLSPTMEHFVSEFRITHQLPL
jgi:hypothetical protein